MATGSDVLALLTNAGKSRIADMLATGKSFKVDTFRLGDGGFDPADPTLPITPDPARTDVYGTPGGVLTKALTSVDLSSPTCPLFVATAAPGEATGIIGSIGLLGTIVYSPIAGDPELGLQFLFALSTRPQTPKTSVDNFVFNIGITL